MQSHTVRISSCIYIHRNLFSFCLHVVGNLEAVELSAVGMIVMRLEAGV